MPKTSSAATTVRQPNAQASRKPEIVADAARIIIGRDSRKATGNFYIDEEVLSSAGVTDFSRYAVQPGSPLIPDLFID